MAKNTGKKGIEDMAALDKRKRKESVAQEKKTRKNEAAITEWQKKLNKK